MTDDDDAEGCEATASGIMDCLRMLLEEAVALRLPRTRDQLQRVIAVCEAESALGAEMRRPLQAPAAVTIH